VEADQREIEATKIDKFNTVIDILKKYKVLNALGDNIYDELHKLRKYRNKVHIQDNIEIDGVSRDEGDAFSDDIRTWAVGLNTKVLKYLSENLGRPKHIERYVNPLVVPSP
jgi:hypothetical protein